MSDGRAGGGTLNVETRRMDNEGTRAVVAAFSTGCVLSLGDRANFRERIFHGRALYFLFFLRVLSLSRL